MKGVFSTPRKSRFKDLRTLDRNSQEYWEEVLRREGLSMSRGSDHHLIHSGDGNDLEKIQSARAADELTGGGKKVDPAGRGPDA